MATVIVSVWGAAGHPLQTPIALRGVPIATEVISSHKANQVSSVWAEAGQIIVVSATGGTVKVAFAEASVPNAATKPHAIVGEGAMMMIEAKTNDTRISVSDA